MNNADPPREIGASKLSSCGNPARDLVIICIKSYVNSMIFLPTKMHSRNNKLWKSFNNVMKGFVIEWLFDKQHKDHSLYGRILGAMHPIEAYY